MPDHETERQKMVRGALYDPRDPELTALRARARDLLRRYNATSEDTALRQALLADLLGRAAGGLWIEPPFYCDYGLNITVGRNVYFNFNCVVLDVAPVIIGDDVLFGPAVQLYTATHPLGAAERRRGLELGKPITIGSDVWVGGAVVVNPGVSIGHGSVIGSGSVVTRDVPAGVFAAGNPCRVVRPLEPVEAGPGPDAGHWAGVYASRSPDSVSWFQPEPALSLSLIRAACEPPARVLDVGGGASFLVDRLLEAGYTPGVLDIAGEPLAIVRKRLGADASRVTWIVEDVTRFAAPEPWDVWHDRAVFHFLNEPRDREAYRRALLAGTRPGSTVIIATFGPEGPLRCSGLPTMRYTPERLAAELGAELELKDHVIELHRTPAGAEQQFVYCRFARR